jgi:phosphatidylserine decarboxylase
MPNILSIIHTDGWKFIAIFAAVAFLLAMINPNLGWVGAILTAWCMYFFRNPPRTVPMREGLIVSPADGIVCQIMSVVPSAELELGDELRTRVSIFLNVFDVHVNRVPVAGVVRKIIYHEGQFLNASFDKASEKNERNTVVIDTITGERIAFVQIAGLIARRIRCDIAPQETVETGQVFGLIRFGSRMDVYLPEGMEPLVVEGQRMVAGETVLLDVNNSEPARRGVKR